MKWRATKGEEGKQMKDICLPLIVVIYHSPIGKCGDTAGCVAACFPHDRIDLLCGL